MDYTKLPKELIYQDRKSLDDFMDNNVTEQLVSNMLDINVLQFSEFEKHALDCLNTAYYICTMVQVESKPEWRFGEYCDISLQLNQYFKEEYQRVVLSLVIILLECCNPEVISHSQVLINKLRAFVTRGGNSTVGIFAGSLGTPILALREIFPRLYQGIDHAIIFPDNEFYIHLLAGCLHPIILRGCRHDFPVVGRQHHAHRGLLLFPGARKAHDDTCRHS